MKFKPEKFENLNVLDTIKCPSCGSSVPISIEEFTDCVFCGEKVKISKEFQELKIKQVNRQKQLDEAQEIYQELSIPPKRWMLIWNSIAEGIFGLLSFVVIVSTWIFGSMAIVIPFLLYFVIMALAPVFHENYLDTIGSGWVYLFTILMLTVLIILPMVLNAYVSDFVTLKATLQNSLMAKFSNDDKKIPLCRNCGAPLDNSQPHFCIPCDYCETENIVINQSDWYLKIKNFTQWQLKTLDTAIKKFHQYKAEIKENLNWWLYGSIFMLIVSYGFGEFIDWVDSDILNPPSWRVLNHSPKMLYANKDHASTIPFNQKTVLKYDEYWIALNYNETLVVQIESESEPEVVISNNTTFEGNLIRETIDKKEENGIVKYEWKAPYRAKYMLTFVGQAPISVLVSTNQ